MKQRTIICVLGLLAILAGLGACGSNSRKGLFTEPIMSAIDSTNNRLFVLESGRKLFALTASTRDGLGNQPIVNKKRFEDIYDLLPESAQDMVVLPSGDESLLFITGSQATDNGDHVLNRVLVLNYDGTTVARSSLSPLEISDGDDATDESQNILGGLIADPDQNRLYVTDSTDGLLYIFDLTDGSQVAAPLALGGVPNRMALDGNRLYIANSSTEEASQLVTIVNTGDLTTTTLDLNIPTSDVAVLSVDSGTILLAQNAQSPQVLVHEMDAVAFNASTPVPNATFENLDGELTAGNGLSSAVGGILLTQSAAGVLYAYVVQADGTLELLTFESDLSSFSAQDLVTATDLLTGIDVYTNGEGDGVTVYMVASASGDLVFTQVGSADVNARF